MSHKAAPASPVAGPDQTIREVFISPRVIDREAFNDYAASLRRLIEQAAGQAETLRGAAAEADQARTAIKELTAKHQSKFDLAARLLNTLDQRAADAERVLEAARTAAASLDHLRADADVALSEYTRRLDAKIEQIAAATQARLDEVEARGRERLERMAADLQAREQAHAQRLEALLAQGEQRVSDLAQAAEQRVTASLRRCDESGDELRLAVERTLNKADGQLRQLVEQLDEAAQRRRGELDQIGESAAAKVSAQHQRLLDLVGQLEDLSAETELMIGASERTDDEGHPLPPLPGSLGESLAQAREAQTGLSASIAELRTLNEQAAQARTMLRGAIDEGCGQVDALERRTTDLSQAAKQAVEASESAQARLAARHETFEREVTKPLDDLQARGAALRGELEALLGRAEHSRQTAESVMSDTYAIFQKLEGLLRELRPWQGVLTQGAATLPEPIQRIIDEVRGEMARDLSVLAAGMYQLAVKAQRVGESVQSPR
jgi:chromosome segregation ATPase